jgi:hypothetical protein
MKTKAKSRSKGKRGRFKEIQRKQGLSGTLWGSGGSGNPRVLAVTAEGTQILKPKGRPTSFDIPDLKRAIAAARTVKGG